MAPLVSARRPLWQKGINYKCLSTQILLGRLWELSSSVNCSVKTHAARVTYWWASGFDSNPCLQQFSMRDEYISCVLKWQRITADIWTHGSQAINPICWTSAAGFVAYVSSAVLWGSNAGNFQSQESCLILSWRQPSLLLQYLERNVAWWMNWQQTQSYQFHLKKVGTYFSCPRSTKWRYIIKDFTRINLHCTKNCGRTIIQTITGMQVFALLMQQK